MAKLTNQKGSCFCGAITFTAKEVDTECHACHCETCRKLGEGPSMSTFCGTDVTFSGEEQLSIYPSSDWAQRGFCSICGTHLFYRILESRTHIISVFVFDEPINFKLTDQVFIDRKPGFYTFANKTREFTAQQVFEQYTEKP